MTVLYVASRIFHLYQYALGYRRKCRNFAFALCLWHYTAGFRMVTHLLWRRTLFIYKFPSEKTWLSFCKAECFAKERSPPTFKFWVRHSLGSNPPPPSNERAFYQLSFCSCFYVGWFSIGISWLPFLQSVKSLLHKQTDGKIWLSCRSYD